MIELEYGDQAERFVSWFSRLPLGTPLEGAFQRWAGSKDFHPEDRKVIWNLVQEDDVGNHRHPPCPNGILMAILDASGGRV